MEAIIIIGGAIFLTWHSIKDEFSDNNTDGIYQENEEKQDKNDTFWP